MAESTSGKRVDVLYDIEDGFFNVKLKVWAVQTMLNESLNSKAKPWPNYDLEAAVMLVGELYRGLQALEKKAVRIACEASEAPCRSSIGETARHAA